MPASLPFPEPLGLFSVAFSGSLSKPFRVGSSVLNNMFACVVLWRSHYTCICMGAAETLLDFVFFHSHPARPAGRNHDSAMCSPICSEDTDCLPGGNLFTEFISFVSFLRRAPGVYF